MDVEFNYLLISCDREAASNEPWEEYGASWYGNAVGEQQLGPKSRSVLYIFEMDDYMSSLAPAQVTLGWDPAPHVRGIFERCGLSPDLEIEMVHCPPGSPVYFFGQVPSNVQLESAFAETPEEADSEGVQRLHQLLLATCELAAREDRGLLFLSTRGQLPAFEDNDLAGQTGLFEVLGLLFTNRHPGQVKLPLTKPVPEPTLRGQVVDLGLWTNMFSMDNEAYPSAANWTAEVEIYDFGREDGGPLQEFKFAFNYHLAGRPRDDLAQGQDIVMFVETPEYGRNLTVNEVSYSLEQFPEGSCLVGFVSGEVRAVELSELSGLRWVP